ncbi:MAG: hypothetical protein ACP5RR_09035 [Candidatus Kapaibacteriota bacterium]|jgi:hypothetical protein
MDYSKLIDLYLEGELNSVEKDLLFKELARNSELQEYLEQQIQFNNLFQKDMQNISVPADVTNNVYSSLNFKIPNMSAPKAAPIVLTGLQNFASRVLPNLLSGIFGGLVTFVLLWLFFLNRNQIGYNSVMEKSVPVGSAVEVPKVVANKETTTEKVNIEKVVRETLEKWLANYLKSKETNEPQQYTSSVEQNQELIGPTLAKNMPLSLRINNANNRAVQNKLNAARDIGLPLLSLHQPTSFASKLKDITFGVRSYLLRSEPDVKVNLDERSILANTGISIGYNLGPSTNIGFEFGQEKFAQKYSLTRYGETTYYKQNPLLFWYGFYFQQGIANLFRWEELKPIARIFLGGTPVGPLARGSVGLQYTPDERVSFYLGWEASILGYKVQDKIYQTKKSGLTYGVTVKY